MSRPPLPDLEVFIDSYDPEGKASYASGHFQFREHQMNFSCIMMDGYGGPNVAVVLPEETQTLLRRYGLDNDAMDSLITALQTKIMEGEARVQLRGESDESK
jgi:hypothetical protein